jgi:hypothetical protein
MNKAYTFNTWLGYGPKFINAAKFCSKRIGKRAKAVALVWANFIENNGSRPAML